MSTIPIDFRNAIIDWAEATPRIRSVWVLGNREKGRPAESGVNLAIEVEPVPDSEETLTVWVAHQKEWQSQLQQQLGSPVELDWFDRDGSTPGIQKALDEGAELIYERAEPQ